MYIKSPLIYNGGKYKLLPQIMSNFPSECDTFVDLFTGGLNVGINVNAKTIYANDRIPYLIEMYHLFQNTNTEELIINIKNIIDEYKLSKTNIDGYNRLREDYNNSKDSLKLFVLTCYSFNHQIRFNNSFKFNTSFGKERSSYNNNIEKHLREFCEALQRKKIVLTNTDFREFDFSILKAKDMVYCDPPYLITTGAYNDGKRGFGDWTQEDDDALLKLLDRLNERKIKFALSNVFYHKGEANEKLIEWSKKYIVTYLDKTYSNCNYHIKERDTKTVEVLVTNYE